jgi:diguanylate cyclase (GGDEF)-like protein
MQGGREDGGNLRDISVLIVDDDPLILKTITNILIRSNTRYYVQTAQNIQDALDLVRKTYWDTILLDLSIPYRPGDEPETSHGIRALKELLVDLSVTAPIIAITGYNDEDLSDVVLDLGAYYFLNKPLRPKSLAAIVKNATGFKMSGFDGLTGLLNRKTFEERLKSEFERVKRKNEENGVYCDQGDGASVSRSYLSLLFIDGDNFKRINDTYNHLVGDQVLKKIGNSFVDDRVYRPVMENGKSLKYIISPYDIAARFGGDEFSIFLPETDHQSALVVARRIRGLVKEYDLSDIVGPGETGVEPMHISLSMGIVTYPIPNVVNSYDELIGLADAAMYASKETRRGYIFGYNSAGILKKKKKGGMGGGGGGGPRLIGAGPVPRRAGLSGPLERPCVARFSRRATTLSEVEQCPDPPMGSLTVLKYCPIFSIQGPTTAPL